MLGNAIAQDKNENTQNQVETIVVTAQKRSESAQKVPVAIDVISAKSMQSSGVTALTGLSRIIPAVQIVQAAGATPLYFMRGVGSLERNFA